MHIHLLILKRVINIYTNINYTDIFHFINLYYLSYLYYYYIIFLFIIQYIILRFFYLLYIIILYISTILCYIYNNNNKKRYHPSHGQNGQDIFLLFSLMLPRNTILNHRPISFFFLLLPFFSPFIFFSFR